MRILFVLLLLVVGLLDDAGAQTDTIRLSNPSFEDTPRKGEAVHGIRGWYDCGIINFPDESPPDIHPQNFWENTKQPSHGDTYLGLVVRDNETYESVSQRLSRPMQAGECYTFSMELARSAKYLSGSRYQLEVNGNQSQNFSYTTPSVIRIWGGSGYCNTKELLGESVPVKHSEWKTYPFKLSPSFNHKYIVIEVYYKVPVLIPYNGHMLVDNLSEIVQINCEDEILAQVEEPKRNIPPHKRFKKKPKKEVKKEEPKPDAVVAEAKPEKKKILNLDRNSLVKNQTLEIKNLYFKSDSSNITTESFEVLDEIFDFLDDNEDITVEIGGHSNLIPKQEYCDSLSENRAKEVAVYLVQRGIPGERVFYRGYGKRKPIIRDKTPSANKKNQRVEIKILSIG